MIEPHRRLPLWPGSRRFKLQDANVVSRSEHLSVPQVFERIFDSTLPSSGRPPCRVHCAYGLRKSVGCGIVDVDAIQHRELWSGGGSGIDAKRHIGRAAEYTLFDLS